MEFDAELSLMLDEVVLLLDVAVSPGIKRILTTRKRVIEELIWNDKEKPPEAGKRLGDEAWNTLRDAVLERDDYRCQGCGRNDVLFNVHHIQPLHSGGSNKMSNLITLCESCHKRIHPWMVIDGH